MSKTWFWSCVGKSLAKTRVQEMLCRMGEEDPVRRLVLDRFCPPTKTLEQCGDYYPPDSQKKDMPDIDRRAKGWAEKNVDFFSAHEMAGIAGYLFHK